MNGPSLFKSGAGLWVGLGLLGLAVLAAWSTAGMKIAPNYARVGPQVFPYAAALILGALGAFFIWQALSGRPDRLQPDTDRTDIAALAAISAGFVVFIATLQTLGFILSATLLFAAVSRGFGSRRILRDGLIGLALCSLAFIVFTRLLDLQLPGGFIGRMF